MGHDETTTVQFASATGNAKVHVPDSWLYATKAHLNVYETQAVSLKPIIV